MRRNRIDASCRAYVSVCLMVLGVMLAIFFIAGCAQGKSAAVQMVTASSGKETVVIRQKPDGLRSEHSRILLRTKSILFSPIAELEIKPGSEHGTFLATVNIKNVDPAWLVGVRFEYENEFFAAEVTDISVSHFEEYDEKTNIVSESAGENPHRILSVLLRPQRQGTTSVRIVIRMRSSQVAPVEMVDNSVSLRIEN